MKRAFLAIVCLMIFGIAGCSGKEKDDKDTVRTLQYDLDDCRDDNRRYAAKIGDLKKAIAVNPDTLQRIWRLKGFDSFRMISPHNRWTTQQDWSCSVSIKQDGIDKEIGFNGYGRTPEMAMVSLLSKVDNMRKELCDALKEVKE